MLGVDYLILADAAVTADGKHYIHGAGWDTIYTASLPTTHPLLAIAVLLRVPWNETNEPHLLELNLQDADGTSILPDPPGPLRGPITVGRPPHAAQGEDQVIPLVFNLVNVSFVRAGTYACVMSIAGTEVRRFPFRVVQMAAQISLAPGGAP